MAFDPYSFDSSAYARQDSLGQYTAKTFLWMVLGLVVTFATALFCWVSNVTILSLMYIPAIHIVALVVTLILSVFMAARIERMRVGTAVACFVAFSLLFGYSLSIYLLVFDAPSFIIAFAATAVYFGALAAYGMLTKRDLSSLGSILVSGLIFLIVFGILSMFLPFLSRFDSIICLVGIAVFLGFTAYDTQKIRHYYQYYSGYPEMLSKASIFSALQLYLDFLNLFLYLLRFLGRNRN